MSETLNLSRQKVEVKLKELFILSMNGNVVAYESFLVLASAIVKKYLTVLGGKYDGKETIEDLLQEILISIHQKKHTFQLERPILPWLYAVTRYRFIDFYRAKKRAPKTVELPDDLSAVENEEPFLNVGEILNMLSPKQRDMLYLVKVEGASYAEAASTLNISVPSLKVGIHRAIKSIKDRISK
jgi:RNA polymerase sigma factor (sigma-70 family)